MGAVTADPTTMQTSGGDDVGSVSGRPGSTDSGKSGSAAGSTSVSGEESASTSDTGETRGETTDGEPTGTPYVYVGTYGSSIHVYALDIETGALTPVSDPVDGGTNPSFLAVDPQRRYLFAVNETGSFEGMQTGAVAAFAIDPRTGGLTFVNRVASGGPGPAHVATDRSGRFVLVANYGGGTVAVLPIGNGGMLGDAVDVKMQGNGAQSHMIVPDPANAFVFVPNKGRDEIAQYVFDENTGTLTANAVPTVALEAGAGPRHLAFHPSLDYAYVVGELDDTIRAYAYDDESGRLTQIQSLGTLPDGFAGSQNTCADVHVHPGGGFVYASNRGHDSIAIFAIDPSNGALTPVGHRSTGGQTPRNFEIAPDGELMLVANQDSDSIVAFSIDDRTGQLAPTGEVTTVASPVFVGVVYLPGR